MPTANFWRLGAFFFLALVTWAKLPIVVAFILTLVGCFILGFLIERFFLRPLIGEKLIFVIMLTVGSGGHVQRPDSADLGRQSAYLSGFFAANHGTAIRRHLYCSCLFGHTDYQHHFSCSVRPVFQKISSGDLYALCGR
ncbi:MAG: hypothetical protein MZU95_01715 [Desulfomicrobium escambiense]|nr:hypothetical protein [Desulfomicrobium escambiense]